MGELFSQDEIDKVIEDIKPYWKDDAISREAVISIIEESQEDDVDEWMDYPWKVTPNLLMDEMRKLPSITPKQVPCEDAISRQAAIDAFSIFAEYESNRTNAEWVDRIRVVLSSLQPVQPIRPRGHWINKELTDEYGVVGNCSECKERRIIDNFCPSCGADMRESEEKDERLYFRTGRSN